jgi:hypothetical protein
MKQRTVPSGYFLTKIRFNNKKNKPENSTNQRKAKQFPGSTKIQQARPEQIRA